MLKKYLAPAAALLCGCAAAFIRSRELSSGYDEKGLPIKGAAVTVILAAFCVIFIAAAFAFAVKTAAGKESGVGVTAAFAGEPAELALSALFAAAAAVCGVLIALAKAGGETASKIYGYGAAASALALLGGELLTMGKRNDAAAGTLLAVPAVYFAFAMAYAYSAHAANPAIMLCAYKCAALGTSALFFIYSASFSFCKKAPKLTVAFGLISSFFLILCIPDYSAGAERFFFAFIAASAAARTGRFIGSLHKKEI
ncbi:MAG: hypothetical protein II425_03620 [Oscillospiraceae bacterium]|nr:hypothetical protein [Oscillospiraceae bacterium]MBQ5504451.1 hypothetical protein [Oscillospiraceae bacterium]MBQ5515175.1 hypothetical protein [Oscillospiraceae bacterium]